ncbi:shikimate kinase [Xylophilus sp.]|uniref:shikimate kinase n=1 Tax=Xylophilus sp. TaxID=2653893 RepID=UPI0013B7812A|nr:shikimate kinase [Xylophilus sp.]KAF1048342.1 MAG: Shikimate kinase 2 [Xylophilus sp.]
MTPVRLIGPGGAGKTTAGAALANRLQARFGDLDAEFIARNGDIADFIGKRGYDAYAAENVQAYLALCDAPAPYGVLALSSGFMTYRDGIHPAYTAIRRQIVSDARAFVLLPSLDLEACVSEIVRRQLQRPLPFVRTPEREERVIRTRFALYADLPVRKVVTHRPVQTVVDEIAALLDPQASVF